MKKLLASLFSFMLVCATAFAAEVELREDHPDVYVVKKGDTLWDISNMFLQNAWLWPEIWHVNPQVDNPHLIFPGDILALVYIDGQPRIIKSDRLADGTVKLSPRQRVLGMDEAIPTIPLDAIKPFLTGARVVSEEELETAPYVLSAAGERMTIAEGDRLYARGFDDSIQQDTYSFFRRGQPYIDPKTEELLGIEAQHLGEGKVARRSPDVTTLDATNSVQEILRGDRLLPAQQNQHPPVFLPKAPHTDIDGQIISVYGGVTQIGQNMVVVLNRGLREGVEAGHVFTVYTAGEKVVDNIATEQRRDSDQVGGWTKFKEAITNEKVTITLPEERAGQLMVFRVFDKVSLALILKAERPIHVLDAIRTPE